MIIRKEIKVKVREKVEGRNKGNIGSIDCSSVCPRSDFLPQVFCHSEHLEIKHSGCLPEAFEAIGSAAGRQEGGW